MQLTRAPGPCIVHTVLDWILQMKWVLKYFASSSHHKFLFKCLDVRNTDPCKEYILQIVRLVTRAALSPPSIWNGIVKVSGPVRFIGLSIFIDWDSWGSDQLVEELRYLETSTIVWVLWQALSNFAIWNISVTYDV